ncbi:DUF1329 domain-containing protein [Solimonas sp. K1W22B-7]|uniref:DUF1329 domain-containing protein n=1 Tax=Solimonas sp. K1W22B-7 TaxID=2303331 RepID=UPI0013C4B6D8|nr:DUF1329 domain-containing protein [Solimonas sp. K1W22B-7]
MRTLSRALLALGLAVAAGPSVAAVTAEESAALGSTLTAVGAERAGNADGTIPPWALDREKQAPAGKLMELGDAEPGAPMFVITIDNMNRFRDWLTEGHMKLLQEYNTYSMQVYPSRRSVRWPENIEKASLLNAQRCKLAGSDDPAGCLLGFPFPIPKTGAEAIWNHKLRWRGEALSRINNNLVVDPKGQFQATRVREDFRFSYANPARPQALDSVNRDIYQLATQTLAPPRLAGTELLIRERTGTGTEGRTAWMGNQKQPRVRREPSACCDNFTPGAEGLQFYDQMDMFNGSLERYSWKLAGKRELLIPYNSQRSVLGADKGDFSRLVKPWHINQTWARYELHRVWVVEAALKKGSAHPVRKRIFYIDEDSWQIAAVDLLDVYDQAYQFQEAHLSYDPQLKATVASAELVYQFDIGRYLVSGLVSPGAGAPPSAEYFTPEALQKRVREGK